MNKTNLKTKRSFWFWLISIGLILSLSVYGRKLQSQFFAQIDTVWIAVAVFSLLFLVLWVMYMKRRVYAISGITLLGVVLFIAGGGVAVYRKYLQPIETIHFFMFFFFGWITAVVFGIKRGLFVVLAVAVSDEILQIYLPDRVGDIHDVAINVLSGIVGLLLGRR